MAVAVSQRYRLKGSDGTVLTGDNYSGGTTCNPKTGVHPKFGDTVTFSIKYDNTEIGGRAQVYILGSTTKGGNAIQSQLFYANDIVSVSGSTGTVDFSGVIDGGIASEYPNSTTTDYYVSVMLRDYARDTTINFKTDTIVIPPSYGIQITSKTITDATANINSQFSGFVQNKSQLKVTVNTKTFHKATTKSVVVNFNGANYSASISNNIGGTEGWGTATATIPCPNAGTFTVTITATDSRGYTATTTQNVTILPYVNPSITNLTVQRCVADGTLNDEGTCAKIEFAYNVASVNSKNTKSFVVQYYNGSSWVDLHRNTTDYSGNSSFVSPEVFDVNNSHQVRAVVADYFTSGTVTRTIDPSFALINFGAGGHSLTIGGQSPNDGAFECRLPTRIYNMDFRLIYGNYGAIFRNDGGNMYFLVTNANDSTGSFNSLRPFSFNLANGNCSVGHTLVANNLALNSGNTFSDFQYSGAGTSGTAGYCCIARFTFTSQYANKPITFDVAGRGRDRPYHCSFQMNNIQYAANLTLKCAYCDNYLSAVPVYIKSCGSGVFEIYVQKSEAWDTVSLENLHYDINYMKITISYPNTHVTSVSGMTQFGPIATYLTSGNFTSYAPRAVNTIRMVRGTTTFTHNSSGNWDYFTLSVLNKLLGVTNCSVSNVSILGSRGGGSINNGITFCYYNGGTCFSLCSQTNYNGGQPVNTCKNVADRLNYVIFYFG